MYSNKKDNFTDIVESEDEENNQDNSSSTENNEIPEGAVTSVDGEVVTLDEKESENK